MNFRQRFLKAIYPLVLAWGKLTGTRRSVLENAGDTAPGHSFYDLAVDLNNGKQLYLSETRGKKVMIVNTASNCGYTGQYDELQRLHEQFRDKLVVIGFPANDFKEQEKGSDDEIAEFCRVNYGVTFPLAKKSTVVKGAGQNRVFQWLTNKPENGWNAQPPTWNFSKYLIDEQGTLTHYFDPAVSPLSDEVVRAVSGK